MAPIITRTPEWLQKHTPWCVCVCACTISIYTCVCVCAVSLALFKVHNRPNAAQSQHIITMLFSTVVAQAFWTDLFFICLHFIYVFVYYVYYVYDVFSLVLSSDTRSVSDIERVMQVIYLIRCTDSYQTVHLVWISRSAEILFEEWIKPPELLSLVQVPLLVLVLVLVPGDLWWSSQCGLPVTGGAEASLFLSCLVGSLNVLFGWFNHRLN